MNILNNLQVTRKNFIKHCKTYLVFILLILFASTSTGFCVDEVLISDNPMEAESKSPPAVIMFVLDNSGSMDWEFMVQNGSGLFEDAGGTRYNLYTNAEYENGEDNQYTSDLSGDDRRWWRSQWAGHNKIYYDPAVTYEPWPGVTGKTMGNADTSKPFSNPYNNASTDSKILLGNTYRTMDGVDVKVAHYFVRHPTSGNVYLVNFTSGVRSYYQLSAADAADFYVDSLTPVAQTNLPDSVKALTNAEDLQNFANWVSYYRRRELTAKAAVALTIRDMSGVQIGFYSLHGGSQGVRQAALDVHVSGSDYTDDLLHDLYDIDSNNGTPLRLALKNVGEYYKVGGSDGGLGTSPYATSTGAECQLTFAIAMTDGHWNGSSPSVGHQDQGMGAPYQDNNSDRLADVAMYYYKNDLAPTVDNNAPTSGCDSATWQHMITYGVSFGVTGDIDPADYPACDYENASGNTPPWNSNKIDDLYHAAVNGRGEFISASDPQELVNSLKEVIASIHSRLGTAASVTVNSQTLITGSMYFQSVFNSETWAGNVKAKALNADGSVVSAPVWNSDVYFTRSNLNYIPYNHADKRIVTYDPTKLFGSRGVEFLYNHLTNDQLISLYPDSGVPTTDATMRGNIVDFIRGRDVNETGFRQRNVTLGDIVHSSPMMYGNTIFVGANDGMLHAFDTANGKERFAYIPNLVMGNFHNSDDFSKSFHQSKYSHRFFIDQSPYIRQGVDNMTLLIGGLGKGGKGVYCLNVKDADNVSSVSDVASMVLWEYPSAADDDMGFTYSRPIIAKSNADIDGNSANHDWIAIFGNGYNSVNGNTVLYILNAKTGTLVKKIDTDKGAGLSSAAVTDINSDLMADYVYAGDLDGNMWKFDLTSSNTSDWDVAYKNGTDPQPLVSVGKPITVRPDVMLHCEYGGGTLMCGSAPEEHKPLRGYMVLFGTGKFLHSPEDFTSGVQYMFGIWDFGDDQDNSEYLGTWNSATNTLSNLDDDIKLLEQEIDGWINTPIGLLPYLTDNKTNWVDNIECDPNSVDQNPDPDPTPVITTSETIPRVGWFRQLQTDHMVNTDPLIHGGSGIYIEMNPNHEVCKSGGISTLWEVDACTGGRINHSVFDTNGDGVINSDDVDGPGIPFDEVIYPPAIIAEGEDGSGGDGEFKLIPTGAGGIEVVKEKGPKRGFTYWQIMDQNN
jgi:type IV pilus assembly protein PilY1